jgi:predicted transglutaminase-like cysteine proteinase
MLKKSLIILPFLIIFLLFFVQKIEKVNLNTENIRFETEINRQIDEALKDSTDALADYLADDNYIETLKDGERLTEKQIQLHFKNRSLKEMSTGVSYWSFSTNVHVTASAFGTDNVHHIINHYLIGYAPFQTEQLWIPHYTISMRLKYQRDAEQFWGLGEVWQNSKQSFFNTRGDCEDHALVLADWLIELGLDARVVLGRYKNGGHAWVVLLKDSEVFLLEATSKQKRKSWRHYPLAKFMHDYNPKCMFNRNYFWLNTGSMYTTDYVSGHWVKKSRFCRGSKQNS